MGNLLSSDVFYNADPTFNQKWKDMGIIAVEMEAAALYMNAARAGKRALAICTVSDHIITGDALNSEERQTSFTEMMLVAIKPEYQGKGAVALIFDDIIPIHNKLGFKYSESNPELETSTKMQSQWDYFERENHKRRRAYMKRL